MAAPPPYLFADGTAAGGGAAEAEYVVVDAEGREARATHRRHGFARVGQRYERLAATMPRGALARARVGRAVVEVFEAAEMWAAAAAALEADPLAFVDDAPDGEAHYLRASADGASFKYAVAPARGAGAPPH